MPGAPGAPLPRLLRARLERLLGATLRDVRVVVSEAPGLLGARAFALGNTLHLSPAAARGSRAARHAVLGHELLHVLQQRRGDTRRHPAESPVLEQEAARAGRRIAAGRAAHLAARRPGRAAPCVQRIKLVLRDTRDGDLDAPALLNMMDSALSAKLAGAPGCAKVRGTYTVTQGGHWLSLLGKLAMGEAIVPFNTRRASALPCSLKISATGTPMPIYAFGGTTERIDFPAGAVRWARGADVARVDDADLKLDLNYIQIADGFQKLNNAGHTDDLIAGDLLLKMKGRAMATDYGANANAFMEAVAGLMFGVEASRFPSCFVTSLLLLDLIRTKKGYGRAGTKRFKLETAFDSGNSFDFNCLYGGKFPCAVHEPGKGNAANRRMLGELGGQALANATLPRGHFTRGQGASMMLDLNHRFIVPRREVTLLIHWIEARVGMAAIPYLSKATLQGIIGTRIDEACADTAVLPALSYAPSKSTGMHASDIPGYRNPITLGMTVYWADYGGTMGKWYHTTRACKKLGGRSEDLARTLTSSYRVQDRTKTVGEGRDARVVNIVPGSTFRRLRVVRDGGDNRATVSLADVNDYPCPHCVS
jgi:hypothetical protein